MRVLLVPNSKATIPAKLSVCHRFAVANKAIAVKMTATKLSASVEVVKGCLAVRWANQPNISALTMSVGNNHCQRKAIRRGPANQASKAIMIKTKLKKKALRYGKPAGV